MTPSRRQFIVGASALAPAPRLKAAPIVAPVAAQVSLRASLGMPPLTLAVLRMHDHTYSLTFPNSRPLR